MSLKKFGLQLLLAASLASCEKSESKAALPPKSPDPNSEGAQAAEGTRVASPSPQDNNAKSPAPTSAATEQAATGGGAANTDSSAHPAATAGSGNSAPVDYRLTGQMTAIRRSQLAYRVSGEIKTILVKPGNTAKAGQVLSSLDDRDFLLRVEAAKSRRDNAKVMLDEADKEFKREQELKRDNASTATSFDKVKSGADQSSINLKLAEIDLRTAENALRDTKLIAPYDCVVAEQMKFDGEAIQQVPPSPVLEVYDIAEPEVSLLAPERLLGQVKIGTKLTVTVPAVNYSGKGHVIRMVPVISDKTRSFQVIAKLDQYDPKVVVGSYTEATID